MATISRSVSRSATFAEPRYSTAQRDGSCTGRPSALDRLGHDSPIFSTAFLKCRAVSRAVPSARSCSCGCCRVNNEIRFSIGTMLSQMHNAGGLWQRGQSGVASAATGSTSAWDCLGIARYTPCGHALQHVRLIRPWRDRLPHGFASDWRDSEPPATGLKLREHLAVSWTLSRGLGMRVAIIGTGIAGNAAAWALSKRYPVTVYDRELRPGGHRHTVTIDYDGTPLAVDIGFIVYNELNYPDLTALFDHL